MFASLRKWLRKYVRKIGAFGVEVEFHPPSVTPTDHPTAPVSIETNGESIATQAAIKPQTGAKNSTPPSAKKLGMTFEEVIQAILRVRPDASRGRTAEHGPYFNKASRMTNFKMHEDDPLRYGATQPNGMTMWLYLGKGGKICCGDKPWE